MKGPGFRISELRWLRKLRTAAHGGQRGVSILRATIENWLKHNASGLAAALAFYAIFSLAPMLIIVIAVAGFFFQEQIAQGEVLAQVGGLVGPEGAKAVQSVLEGVARPGAGIVATLAGIVTLLLGATAILSQLQYGLNQVWEVEPAPGQKWTSIIFQRLKFVLMIAGFGVLLMASLVAGAVIEGVSKYITGVDPTFLWELANFFVPLGLTTVLFAMIFKLLPDVEVAWRDVWVGALFTAVLFSAGKTVIGMYLGRAASSSLYAAAGSFVIILLWVYYSAMILYLGAEFTRVWAIRHHANVRLKQIAQPMDDASAA